MGDILEFYLPQHCGNSLNNCLLYNTFNHLKNLSFLKFEEIISNYDLKPHKIPCYTINV